MQIYEKGENFMPKTGGDYEKIALFRYSLIVPALNGTYSEKSINEYFIMYRKLLMVS